MATGDTIFALSSGSLPAGIAVVRISGPDASRVGVIVPNGLPEDRRPALRLLSDERHGIIDHALILRMWAPHSFTGEDSVELHLHGGKAVVTACLQALASLSGFRMAEPGEFTHRAFLNGKMDLQQAEALSDLIAAETEAQRRLSIENSNGANTAVWSQWMAELTDARALLEAELDFSDEEDVPGSMLEQVLARLEGISSRMESELKLVHSAEIMRDGFRVVLTGAPNVGKSSLLNALAKRDAAIVSEEAGTTRDLVEVALDLNGYKVILTDTAGLRDATGVVERIGIERAVSAIGAADLVLNVISADQESSPPVTYASTGQTWRVANKQDLFDTASLQADFHVSATTGKGLDSLLAAISDAVGEANLGGNNMPLLFKERHVLLCKEARIAIDNALPLVESNPELAAEELRRAMFAIGRVTGTVDVEDLLGVIFSRFCIGK
ncbi:MAG: tRNA uridine-5-carboxymethylaminomethyl(34) synthesis GTPase MnmE [Phyllobacteriaceae bacterium]|nr:tRNA uridine-5-carboxymethylaminomethyl(34) synthesis GTPase MnmE [Phyllobacteriaceae bacterium]MBA93267.1 tRNA uridine-5-carboxymethylaminomethyl(34) synthesis GTPase MnmE [Phyllobacteriaceae bacterium]